MSGGLFDWSGGADNAPAPRGRRMVLVVCCPDCQSLDVRRHASKGIKGYWSCQGCGEQWTESADTGMGLTGRIVEV